MVDRPNPLERLVSTQRAALSMFTDRLDALATTLGRTGVVAPDEALRQLVSVVRAAGDLAASTARPLEMFLETQQQLATTMRSYADLQHRLAEVLSVLADNQAAVVEALETLSNPILGAADALRTAPPTTADRQEAAPTA